MIKKNMNKDIIPLHVYLYTDILVGNDLVEMIKD